MQRLFNIIIILAVYFGILYHRNMENHTAKHTENKTKITKKNSIKHHKRYSKIDTGKDLY